MMISLRGAVLALWTGALMAAAPIPAFTAEGKSLDTMNQLTFTRPAEKGSVELVEGKSGKAIRFVFEEDCRGVFSAGPSLANADWDRAAGISFWVKGDGSSHLGGLEFVWNEDYGVRYACAFPINGKEWRKVVVPWRDLLPELSKSYKPLDPARGNAPSRLGRISFGKWWYWKDYAAHSYAIDDIRLEPVIERDARSYRPAGDPLARVRRNLRARQPVTIVTMGDSLTDTAHWTNRETDWPERLRKKLQDKYGSAVRIVNPAMGGTELTQNLILMPRWLQECPDPDLVTVFFGGNDWASGMRGEGFLAVQQEAVIRIRRATKGRADVLLMATCPSLDNLDPIGELAEACRQAARSQKAGLADIYKLFRAALDSDRERLFAWDRVHLSPAGQEAVADAALKVIGGE
ncbi:MAG: hypothetical protein IT210_19165 [Armatimonadetes bacterium]|nr:hypothetical protein [Armatimonadota bacterium]